jgi:hypothetical protein
VTPRSIDAVPVYDAWEYVRESAPNAGGLPRILALGETWRERPPSAELMRESSAGYQAEHARITAAIADLEKVEPGRHLFYDRRKAPPASYTRAAL